MELINEHFGLLKPSLIVCEQNGKIIHLDSECKDIFHVNANSPSELSLENLFSHLNTEGKKFAQEILTEDKNIFLPIRSEEPENNIGLRIKSQIINDQVSILVYPDLGDSKQIETIFIDDVNNSEALMRSLFFRLKRSENISQIYEKHFPGILFQQRADLSFNYISPNFFNLFNTSEKPFLRSSEAFLNLIVENDRDYYLNETREGALSGNVFNLKYRIRLPFDGQIVYILDIRTPRLMNNGKLLNFEGIWLDITQQSLAEQRIKNVGWSETVNALSSGLLHDFKNNITGISTLMEIYSNNLSEDHPWYQGMKMIRESALNAQKTVSKITGLYREKSNEREYFNLVDLVTEQAEIFKHILARKDQLTIHSSSDEIPVYLPGVELKQVVLNLLMNARDASTKDGQLELSISSVKAGQNLFPESAIDKGIAKKPGALIAIKDFGSGIPLHLQQQVFNPYFTTKGITKGSGLGLYNAKLFVKSNNGLITLESEAEKGTTIYVYLPVTNFTETISRAPELILEREPKSDKGMVVFYGKSKIENIEDGIRDKGYTVAHFNSVDKLNGFIQENADTNLLIAITESKINSDLYDLMKKFQSINQNIALARIVNNEDENHDTYDDLNIFSLMCSPYHPTERILWQLIDLIP